MAQDPRQPAQVRWLSAAQLIGVVRSAPGITRAAAAQRLGIGSGGATELVGRMRQARLLDETPAPAQGRGRPTTVLGPHVDGPLVLAMDLRAADWPRSKQPLPRFDGSRCACGARRSASSAKPKRRCVPCTGSMHTRTAGSPSASACIRPGGDTHQLMTVQHQHTRFYVAR